MFKDKHYFSVGVFVLLALALGGYFVYWLGTSKEPDNVRRYQVYFEDSVRGLTKGSSVLYMGVKVGRVYDIRLNESRPNEVEVIIDVKDTTPMRTNTRASVQMQGLTGLAFVSLEQAPEAGQPLQYPAQGLPEIPSRESQLSKLFESAPALMEQVTDLTRSINNLFSEENVAHVSSILARADQASRNLEPAMQEMTSLLQETRQAMQQMNAVATSLRRTNERLEPEIVGTVQNVQTTAQNMARVTEELERLISDNRQGVNRFVNEDLADFGLLINESRRAAQEIERLAESLQRNPTQLIVPNNVERMEIDR